MTTKTPILLALACAALLVPCFLFPAWAANGAAALGPATLRTSDGSVLVLWGVKPPPSLGAKEYGRGQDALGSLLARGGVSCDVQPNNAGYCKNADNIDLALAMIQAGYLVVDRTVVRGTNLAGPYLRAEAAAQTMESGLWGQTTTTSPPQREASDLPGHLLSVLLALLAFVPVYVLMSRRLTRLDAAMRETSRLLVRKAEVERQERGILAAMLEAELRANKTKIDAFLIIYEEQLERLRASEGSGVSHGRRAGDVIHKRPALQRTVFDRVRLRLVLLGPDLARALRSLYAGVEVETEYIDISPTTPAAEVSQALESALGHCRALDTQIQKVLPQLERIAAAAPPPVEPPPEAEEAGV
ncbi:MAG TPA: hypothetical protein DDX54_04485 [Rhodospirillaceae bacterium]|jgi:hypothetical protein|nr:hypothetical protein [Alphaproteobacteria bacterium]HBH26640.1 hypothetical protein [Rhodospirillaceae bacterium]